ncbi:hypothetical protein DV736_g6608, partial [Chaetothyriales sp. CBS 134916]
MKDILLSNVREEWELNYRNRTFQDTTEVPQIPPLKRQYIQKPKEPDDFEKWLSDDKDNALEDTINDSAQFDNYINSVCISKGVNNYIAWWSQQSAGGLKQQAYDVLSVPAMSAEVERLFSACSLMVALNRSRLHNNTIEEAECLKQWLDTGIVMLHRGDRTYEEIQEMDEEPVDPSLTAVLDQLIEEAHEEDEEGADKDIDEEDVEDVTVSDSDI